MGRIDGYHMMIISQYFCSIKDFISLEFVNKKYKGNMSKFHFNPIPIYNRTINYFPNIETLNLWDANDPNFGNDIYDITYFPTYKRNFFQVNIWFEVAFTDYLNVGAISYLSFKNLVVTNKDQKSFKKIRSIEIPQNVRKLEEMCFCGNGSIQSVSLPPTVTILGRKSLCSCKSLSTVEMSENIYSIGESCFFNC
ncbi:hypothetical protein EIN_489180, partial [Entamoeba invadens IP1]